MKKEKLAVVLLPLTFLSLSVFAASINSTTYKQTVIVSEGSVNATSQSYKLNSVLGIINGIINSTSFVNKLGFFHILLLADNQPCTSASQCEGGFCCSNLCKSSACPTTSKTSTESGGGGGAASGGGAGGGGSILPVEQPKIKDYSIRRSAVKEHLPLGTSRTQTITIKNTGNVLLKFNLNVLAIKEFVFLSDASFSLEPGQSQNVDLNFIGKKLGSYAGEIQISADGIAKSVSIMIEVESEQVLFDAKMEIPSGYSEIKQGDDLKAQITLLNVGPPRKVDVTAKYLIKDKLGNIISEASETFAVEKQISFVKAFKLPKNIKPGEYLAVVEVTYEKSFAISSDIFKVIPKDASTIQKITLNKYTKYAYPAAFGVMILLVYLLVSRIKFFRKFFGRKK